MHTYSFVNRFYGIHLFVIFSPFISYTYSHMFICFSSQKHQWGSSSSSSSNNRKKESESNMNMPDDTNDWYFTRCNWLMIYVSMKFSFLFYLSRLSSQHSIFQFVVFFLFCICKCYLSLYIFFFSIMPRITTTKKTTLNLFSLCLTRSGWIWSEEKLMTRKWISRRKNVKRAKEFQRK